MNAVIDYSNERPIAVQENGGTATYTNVNILDKLGNTVAVLSVQDGQVHLRAVNAIPSNVAEPLAVPLARKGRKSRPCGCLGG